MPDNLDDLFEINKNLDSSGNLSDDIEKQKEKKNETLPKPSEQSTSTGVNSYIILKFLSNLFYFIALIEFIGLFSNYSLVDSPYSFSIFFVIGRFFGWLFSKLANETKNTKSDLSLEKKDNSNTKDKVESAKPTDIINKNEKLSSEPVLNNVLDLKEIPDGNDRVIKDSPKSAHSEKEQITQPRPRLGAQGQISQVSKKSFTPVLIAVFLIGLFLATVLISQKGFFSLSDFIKNTNQTPVSVSTINELSTSVAATIIAEMTKTQAAAPAILTPTEQTQNTPIIVAAFTIQPTTTPIPTNSPIPQVVYVTQVIPVTETIYIYPTITPNAAIFHNTPPTFVYPLDGGTIDYEGAYLFKVNSVQGANGYLWGFFQDGIMVWENLRDENQLSGTEYGIHTDSVAHTKFKVGYIEVWVRASIAGQWTDATVIKLYLKPR